MLPYKKGSVPTHNVELFFKSPPYRPLGHFRLDIMLFVRATSGPQGGRFRVKCILINPLKPSDNFSCRFIQCYSYESTISKPASMGLDLKYCNLLETIKQLSCVFKLQFILLPVRLGLLLLIFLKILLEVHYCWSLYAYHYWRNLCL